MARKSIRTDRARAVFLEVLSRTCNVSESARRARIGRSAAYQWRADDPEFAADWVEAEEIAADSLVKLAWERAKDDKSDRMLEILLKAHRPMYREKQAVELSGPNGSPIEYRAAAKQEIADLSTTSPSARRKTG